MKKYFFFLFGALLLQTSFAQQFDIVLKNGHVIDPKNSIDAIMDVAVKDGRLQKLQKALMHQQQKK